jgi:hypothetical protein
MHGWHENEEASGTGGPALKFHDSILGPTQRRALKASGSFLTERGFYLAGGTALALRLGHRRSVDLDWFTENLIADPLQLAAEMRDAGIPFETTSVARGTLYGTVNGVRMSCIEFRYPLLDGVDLWPEYGCALASLRDIGTMKISAVAQRAAKKDFIDLYALGVAGISLSELLASYQQRFRVSDIGHVMYALSYFDQADAERTPQMLVKIRWSDIKSALIREVRRLSP